MDRVVGFRWQFYPSFRFNYGKNLDEEYSLWHHYLTLGPLQMMWITGDKDG